MSADFELVATGFRSVDFKKVWSDNGNALALRPASVRVQLVQVSHAGTEANFGSPVTVSGTGSTWSHTFSDLPVYDRAGNEYSYKATELGSGTGALRNYRSQFQVDAVTGAITITNTLQTVHVPVEKVWVGDGGRLEYRPSSVEIQLKRSTGGTPVNVGSAYSLSGSGDTWQHTFTGLPGYDAFGNEYTYSVEELGVGTGALRAYRSGGAVGR